MSPASRLIFRKRRECLRASVAWLAALNFPLRADNSLTYLPPITLLASDGEQVLAASSRWRATYIDFWASWCGPCKLSFPWMNHLHDTESVRGLRVVAINLDRREQDAHRFLQQNPARFALAMDPEAQQAKRINIQAMPTSMLVASDKSILFTHRGFRPDDGPDLERRIAAALALR